MVLIKVLIVAAASGSSTRHSSMLGGADWRPASGLGPEPESRPEGAQSRSPRCEEGQGQGQAWQSSVSSAGR